MKWKDVKISCIDVYESKTKYRPLNDEHTTRNWWVEVMATATALSILSSSKSLSSSSSSSPNHNHFRRKTPKIQSNNLIKFRPILNQSSSSIEPDGGSPERFLENNSIADYMRFKKGDSGELQTAVVSYRKKLPWSLLQPFLQVSWLIYPIWFNSIALFLNFVFIFCRLIWFPLSTLLIKSKFF